MTWHVVWLKKQTVMTLLTQYREWQQTHGRPTEEQQSDSHGQSQSPMLGQSNAQKNEGKTNE
jgi:hypothetical protein